MSFLSNISAAFSSSAVYQPAAVADKSTANPTATPFNVNDTVTISAEAQLAYQQIISTQPYEFQTKPNLANNHRELLTPENYQQQQQIYRTQHSNHTDIDAWAFGGTSYMKPLAQLLELALQGHDKTAAESAYSQMQTALETADTKISKLLKDNNITLSKNETLELSLDQDSNITVGGMSGDKRRNIENVLNSDKTLWRDMIASHAFRTKAERSLGNSQTAPYAVSNALLKQTVGEILQNEYGVSIDDFELNRSDEFAADKLEIKSKSGNDALLQTLYSEEFELYESLVSVVNRSADSSNNFNIGFSYRNGVTVENGKSDAEGLNAFAGKAVSTALSIVKDYSVTVNSDGAVTQAQSPHTEHSAAFGNWVKSMNVSSLSAGTYNPNNLYFNQPVLRQYVVDMQRLTKFNTGAEADWSSITFGKTGGVSFSVAVK